MEVRERQVMAQVWAADLEISSLEEEVLARRRTMRTRERTREFSGHLCCSSFGITSAVMSRGGARNGGAHKGHID